MSVAWGAVAKCLRLKQMSHYLHNIHAVLFCKRKGAVTTDSLKTEVANDLYVHIQNKYKKRMMLILVSRYDNSDGIKTTNV
jgi:hypothetical protein